MDVVLEVFDTFLFDRMYATLLPLQSTPSPSDPISTLTASGLKGSNANATWNSAVGAAQSALSSWQFQPASQYFSVQPSEYAYLSQWDRDNLYRQCVTLYIVTAYVAPFS